VIPVNRWPVLRTEAIRRRLYEVLSGVEVSDGANWFQEIPVLRVAT
jgi:hypothetical protein